MLRTLARATTGATWIAVAVWAAVIFIGSSRPGSTIPGGYSVPGHLGEYFILGALLFWALRPGREAGRAVALALVTASLYGITDEWHQHFVVMRTPDVTDWGLDTIGALLGALVLCGIAEWVQRRRTASLPAATAEQARGR
jgi:VanZ family protein